MLRYEHMREIEQWIHYLQKGTKGQRRRIRIVLACLDSDSIEETVHYVQNALFCFFWHVKRPLVNRNKVNGAEPSQAFLHSSDAPRRLNHSLLILILAILNSV